MSPHQDVIGALGSFFSTWLSNPYLGALVVPVGFFVMGAFGKGVIRDGRGQGGGPFFALTDWYLAPDAALATLGVGLAECIERTAKFDPATHHGEIRAVLVFVAFAFFVYLIVLSLHKHYEPESVEVWKKVVWLAGLANVLAFMSMFVFLLAFKGVSNV